MEKEKNTKIAEDILRVRLGQMIINEKNKKGDFKIPIHLALGHEAVAVAVDSIMEGEDKLVLPHRNMHYNLARIKSLKPQLDEYLLKKNGLAMGELGSMNLANEEKNIIYTSSILGNNLSVAAGLALGQKVKGVNGIIIVVTGDGAIEEGAFYESLLFMRSLKLSAIVIVENNKWSLATEIKERRCDINIKKIAESMDIHYEKIAGNNVYEYFKKLNNIRKAVVNSKKPAVIEVEISTLGGYFKADGNKKRKFVNYHAGPAHEISLTNGPKIENSKKDPVYLIEKTIGGKQFQKIYQQILEELKKEINEVF